MVDYHYMLVDASTGHNITQLDLTPTGPATRVLNGVGQFPFNVPLYDPDAVYTNLQGDREITIVRAGVPVWNGPIDVIGDANYSTTPPTLPIIAREASWYLSKRTLEMDKHYDADLYYIVRNLVTYMLTKQSNGLTSGGSNINAALPRFSVAPASGNSGITKHVAYVGTARRLISDIIDELVADPTTGLDYRMDYGSGSSLDLCQRTLTFGAPSLGTARTQLLTEHTLTDFSKRQERARAANRVHTVGAGYTYTLQNTGSVANGDILIESVFDRSDTSNQTVIQAYTADARRRTQPPITTYTFSYTPTGASGAFPFGWCDLGDTVQLATGGVTVLHSNAKRRVIELDLMPSVNGSPELVTGIVNLPLDELGT